MAITTAEREKRLTDAIKYFYAYNRSIRIRKVAAKFKVSYTTLGNRLNGKHNTVASNGGHNKLLAFAQLGALLLYIRKQALAGFPCTWAIILAAVTWIRAQDSLSPPSRSWSKKFLSKNSLILTGGFYKIK